MSSLVEVFCSGIIMLSLLGWLGLCIVCGLICTIFFFAFHSKLPVSQLQIPLLNKQTETSKRPLLTLLVQQIGIIVGFLIMWIITIYEGELEQIGQPDDNH